jgi:phytoene/squalene synthetase
MLRASLAVRRRALLDAARSSRGLASGAEPPAPATAKPRKRMERFIPPRTARYEPVEMKMEDLSKPSDGPASPPLREPVPFFDGSEAVDEDYWRETARKRDRDGSLAAAVMPKEHAEAMFLVRALNAEVAAVFDNARGNANAMDLRFQFWRDLVHRAARGRGHPHPMSVPLSIVMRRFSLTEQYLLRLIDARATDASHRLTLSDEAARPQTIEDVEAYADATEGSVLLLALEVMGVRSHPEAETAAGYVGRAVTIANLIRGMWVHASLGQTYLPNEMLEAHKLSSSEVFRLFRAIGRERSLERAAKSQGIAPHSKPANDPNVLSSVELLAPTHDKLSAVCFEFATAGHDNLLVARKQSVPRDAALALLPAVPAAVWYDHFQTIGFDPTHPHIAPRGYLGILARLVWHRWMGTF